MCTTSIHVLFGLPFGLEPPLHTPCISSPNHCRLFVTHAHTMTTCSAAVPRLLTEDEACVDWYPGGVLPPAGGEDLQDTEGTGRETTEAVTATDGRHHG